MKKLIITLATIGIACCVVGIMLVNSLRPDPIPVQPPATLHSQHAPKYVLNAENVYREIMDNGIVFSDVVLRQSILETGHYSSYNCIERNNLFGMTGGEKTSDNIHGYAIYSNWMESVEAYKKWQTKRVTDRTHDYYQFLEDWSYAESEEYERKLKSINLIIVKS